jgi:hypothetical protein
MCDAVVISLHSRLMVPLFLLPVAFQRKTSSKETVNFSSTSGKQGAPKLERDGVNSQERRNARAIPYFP